MIKRCIGIDISASHLRAVQVLQDGRQLSIEQVFSAQFDRAEGCRPEMIESLFGQYGFDRKAETAIAMPHGSVFFRNIETNSASSGRMGTLDTTLLEHSFPVEPEEILAQACSKRRLSNDKYSVLVAATTKAALSDRLKAFEGTEITADCANAVILAVRTAVEANYPEIHSGDAIIVYVDESYLSLAVTRGGDILIIRSMPVVVDSGQNTDILSSQLVEQLAREIEITRQKVLTDEKSRSGCGVYIAATIKVNDNFRAAVEDKLKTSVVAVDPYAKVENIAEQSDKTVVCVAEGLALALLEPEKTTAVNFLESSQKSAKQALNIKKEITICAALAAAIVVVLLGGLFMRLLMLESEYARIEDESKELFKKAFPSEVSIVDPLAQTEQKLQAIQKDYSLFSPAGNASMDPLGVLYSLSATAPGRSNIDIDSFLVNGELVRLKGNAESFEAVYNWQRELEKIQGFENVDTENVGKDSKNRLANFTMVISLSPTEAKL